MRDAHDPAKITAHLERVASATESLAAARGEYGKISLERSFYRWDFFYRALYVFLLGTVLAEISWLMPRVRWLKRGVLFAAIAGCALVVAGVTVRCVLRDRPPVSTLYETILFITGTAVLVCLLVHAMARMRLATTLAVFIGAAGMFMANRYELREAVSAGDTMPSLVAVLDSNYWLATHVTDHHPGLRGGALGLLPGSYLAGRTPLRCADRRHGLVSQPGASDLRCRGFRSAPIGRRNHPGRRLGQ